MLICFLFISKSFSQELKKVANEFENFRFTAAQKELQKIDISKLSLNDKAHYYLLSGKIYSKLNNTDVSCQNYFKAKEYYKKLGQTDKVQDINLDLAHIINAQQNNKNNAQKYIDEYLNYAIRTNNVHHLAKGYKQLATMKVGQDNQQSIVLFKKALEYNHLVNDELLYSQIYNNIGVVYNVFLNQPDSALYYLNKAIKFDIKDHNYNGICYNYINQASSYTYLGDFQQSINYLKKADATPLREFHKKTKALIYENLSNNYDSIQDAKNAFYYLKLGQKYKDSLNEEQQNIAINDIQTKYETKEKEIENLSLKAKLQANRVIIYTIIGILLISILMGILVYKNLSKKKKIAEQEKLIETQKIEKILKDHELNQIDVMLESQEKERQHIANELHDSLGSQLATLKLNFQNLKRQKTNTTEQENLLFEKTDQLIEDTYQQVRNISHLKNLGIVGNEGLLLSVKKMAEKMSIINQLTINVIPFGLNERLENQTEVILFRMMQELCTNIIKHSEANEVNIYLNQHNANEMNIMIEDNGKGFDPKRIATKEGIGLKSIEKKVEQMGGTFTIDSIVSKGTTIIIDIPI